MLSMAIVALAALVQFELAAYLGPDAGLDPELGLLLTEGTTDNGDRIVYERPVVLIPAVLAEGETHQTLRRFVLTHEGTKKDVGSHYFEAEVVGTETLPGLGECVRIRRHSLRMDFSGAQVGEDITEWYQKAKGVVRVSGERYWKDADGRITRSETIQ